MKKLQFTLLFIIILKLGFTQDTVRHRSSFISLQNLQIKEGANFGLVFRGPAFDYGMHWRYKFNKHLLTYEYEIGLGVPFTKDIPGMAFYLKPIDLAFMHSL